MDALHGIDLPCNVVPLFNYAQNLIVTWKDTIP